MDFDLEKVAVRQAAIRQSQCALLVGDSSKFRKSAIVRFATEEKSIVLSWTQDPEISSLLS